MNKYKLFFKLYILFKNIIEIEIYHFFNIYIFFKNI